MEQGFPKYTPVRHKKEGYKGWIHEATRMKEFFTGNVECDWQYTIRVEGSDMMKVAPEEDLEVITDAKIFPPFINKPKSSASGFQDETKLHALGYQITDLSSNERWKILTNVAIPILGLEETVKTILDLMFARLKPAGEKAEKYYSALSEWNHDLEMLLDKFKDAPELKNQRLNNYVQSIRKMMADLKTKRG